MHKSILPVADGFWNIRGSYKIAGILDVGTHASLVRLSNGRFVFLDSYTLSEPVKRDLDALTDGGAAVDAILNVHPFHTVHVKAMHSMYPKAKLHGTARHLSRFPELPWEKVKTEDPEARALFAEDFDLSVPRGVDFIPDNPNLHFSSVLVRHRATKTIHVDDTLMFLRLPFPISLFAGKERTAFHPTLARVLERRAGAASDFRAWVNELVRQWGDTENLCAAHGAALLARDNSGPSIKDRIVEAFARVEKTLAAHEKKHG